MGLSAHARGALVDVGCGAGAFLARMRDLGWSVAGVDLDPAAVRQARALGLEVHEGDLASAAHRDNRFDAVTLRHVVEHVANPMALLRECWRVLKPGGVLSAVTPNADSLGHRLFGADWRGLEPPRHLQVFTVPSLGALVARAGFQSVRCRSIAHARDILQESWLLRRGERPGGGRRAPAWARRLVDGLGCVEQVLVLGHPRAGEEVWVQAVKGGPAS